RRHTRFSRDWSSDVCSSDLYPSTTRHCWTFCCGEASTHSMQHDMPGRWGIGVARHCVTARQEEEAGRSKSTAHSQHVVVCCMVRSEERRVGKECRCRWSAGR